MCNDRSNSCSHEDTKFAQQCFDPVMYDHIGTCIRKGVKVWLRHVTRSHLYARGPIVLQVKWLVGCLCESFPTRCDSCNCPL